MQRFNNTLPEDFERTDGKAPCHECNRITKADDMAELDGKHFCDRCFDPKQAAHSFIVSLVEQLSAENRGLKAERIRLNAELNKTRRAA